MNTDSSSAAGATEAASPVWVFQTDNNEDLRKEGLAGDRVWWMVRDGALEVRGSKGAIMQDGVVKFPDTQGGVLRIAAADVARMRVGYQMRKGLVYVTQVWRKGTAKPLPVPPTRDDWTAYTPVVREFAAQVAQHGGLERIETGRSRLSALVTLNLLYFLPLGYLWMFLADFIEVGPAAAVVLLLFAFLLWFRNPHWPRRIRNLAELEDHLPYVPAGNTVNIYLAARPFPVANNDSLIAHGLAGDWVWVMPRDGALDLHGDKGSEVRDGRTELHADGGTLTITAAEVASMRVDYQDGKRRFYETWFLREGSNQPLWLIPELALDSGYTQTMQSFAASVAKQHGLHRVLIGSTKLHALFAPVLFQIIPLAAIGGVLFAPAVQLSTRITVVAIASAFILLLQSCSIWLSWPRPVRKLADLDRYLPPLPR